MCVNIEWHVFLWLELLYHGHAYEQLDEEGALSMYHIGQVSNVIGAKVDNITDAYRSHRLHRSQLER